MYHIYIGNSKVKLQCPPDNIRMTYGGLNDTVTLLDGTEINRIKGQKLTEVTIDELPLFQYKQPFMSGKFHTPEYYLNHLSNLKSSKKAFSLIIRRYDTQGKGMFRTGLKVTLEDYTVNEKAEEPDMFFVDIKFKLYVSRKNIKLTKITVNSDTGKVTAKKGQKKRDSTKSIPSTYVIKNCDTLGGIAKKVLGNTKYWINIYNANKNLIEKTAQKHKKLSSEKGKFLWAGTKLVIPKV